MKMSVRTLLFRSVIKSSIMLAFMFPNFLRAQETLNALNISPIGGAVVGYASQGIGWSFVLTSDVLVTAINSTAPQVNFWSGTNQNIATYNYAGPYANGGGIPSISAPTNFQVMPPLLLSAGQIYFISTQQTNFTSSVNVYVYSLNGIGGLLPFSTSPFITQFASYYLSSGGQWSPTTTPASENANYALLGPNFQFQVVPEPAIFELLILSVAVLGVLFFRRRAASNFFHDRKTL